MARISKVQAEMNLKMQEKEVLVEADAVETEEESAIVVEEVKTAPAPSMHKLETFNDERVTEDVDYGGRMKMTPADKLMSMTNAIKILPPNMIKDGRHTKENIGAICGFLVTDDMWNEVYKDFKHTPYGY